MSKKLTALSVTLITVGSVDSIRNLPAAALIGSNLFFYFSLALVFFLLPCAIIACWFSTQSHDGIYGWVTKSLGKKAGFTAIWFQWMQNILIYPTFLSFIAGAFLFCIDPKLVEQKGLLFILINLCIWSLTWVNIKGINLSHRFSVFCSLVGLVIPFILLLSIGLFWIITQPHAFPLAPPAQQETWTSLTAIILSFCGIEIAAVHIQECKPGVFSKAIAFSVIIIFMTMLLGALTLAMLLSPQQLNFISGIPKLFQVFFAQIKCEKMSIVINGLIVIGCIGCANNWLISPLKGLLFASKEFNDLDINLSKKPMTKLLLIQACGISLLSTLFLLLPSINDSYWIMITLATQMYLLMYFLMFVGAIRASWQTKNRMRWAIILISILGLCGISIALIVSFNPPSSLENNSPTIYALFLVVSLLIMTLASVLGKRMLYYSPY
ncbi:MAG: APC family permease [Legionella sp.]|nr:APC family permease [Legionella sp.]